jgi:hypothetical protein
MSVYVGMDVHRKRSQIAIVDQAGAVQRNRNLPNDPAELQGLEPELLGCCSVPAWR